MQFCLITNWGKQNFVADMYIMDYSRRQSGFLIECEVLRELVERNPNYTLTFVGHSLGAGL